MKYYLMRAAVLASILSVGVFARASAHSNHNQGSQAQKRLLSRQAKITREQAQEVALRRAPGKIESSELERERGKLVYSFDIRNSKGTITEVQVSALTGRVVRVEQENKKREAAERRKEQKKAGNNRLQP